MITDIPQPPMIVVVDSRFRGDLAPQKVAMEINLRATRQDIPQALGIPGISGLRFEHYASARQVVLAELCFADNKLAPRGLEMTPSGCYKPAPHMAEGVIWANKMAPFIYRLGGVYEARP